MADLKKWGDCERCGQHAWLQSHTCPPRWRAWDTDMECGDSEGAGSEVYAVDACEAAEKFCADYFYEAEYPDTIHVAVEAGDGTVSRWTVQVEFEPTFSAYERAEAKRGSDD